MTSRAQIATLAACVALPALAIYSFESLAGLVAIVGVLAADRRTLTRAGRWLTDFAPVQWLALLALWLVVSALWADAPLASLQKAVSLAALWGLGLLFAAAQFELTDGQKHRAIRFLVSAVAVMVLVYGLEWVTDGAFARIVKHITPSADIEPGAVGHVALVKIERGVTALVCILWAATLGAARVVRPWAGVLLALGSAAAIVVMPNATSVLALALAASAFGAVWLAPRIASLAIAAALMLEILAFPWIMLALPRGGTIDATAEALKFSAIHRLEIYRYVSGLIADRPLFGYGFDASRALSKSAPKELLPGFDHPVPLISLHPHNAVLQVWLETGAVGAFVLALFVAMLARYLITVPSTRMTRAMHFATLTAVATIASLSFGVWQYHWQSVIVLAVAFCALVSSYSAPKSEPIERNPGP